MASGDSLLQFQPLGYEHPTSNYATLSVRNNRIALEFDAAGNDVAYWTAVMPQSFAGTTGVDVIVHWAAATATTGDVDWDVAFESLHATFDTDTNGFDTTVSNDNNTVPGVAGYTTSTTVAVVNANMDAVGAGDLFRMSLTRDSTADTAAGGIQVFAVELEET